MQTYLGNVFDLDGERTYDIRDIAHALSRICRYGGHVREFYSVAQHSVLVSRHVPRADALWGLLHDATEAYLGDVVRGLKYRPQMIEYRRIEKQIEREICQVFGLPFEMPESVRYVDEAILANEKRDIMVPSTRDWALRYKPLEGLTIKPLLPDAAKILFLERWAELTQ